MPFLKVNDAQLYYEDCGVGPALLLLHAGWGTPINGFTHQVAVFSEDYRLIIPDRRGYGCSSSLNELGPDFHHLAAADMVALLDGLGIEQAHVWGHSDGAVIGALMAIHYPQRIRSLVFEGGHLYCRKPRSVSLFRQVLDHPDSIPEKSRRRLAAWHGEPQWREVLQRWARAWLALYEREGDLYRGQLNRIQCPTLVLHGLQDEHTTVQEAQTLATQIPRAILYLFPQGGHSPHDQWETRDTCNALVRRFLSAVEAGQPFIPEEVIP